MVNFTNLLIRPLMRDIKDKAGNVVTRMVQNFGYVISETPCPLCRHEIEENKMRNKGWEHICEACGNYIVFTDIEPYIKAIGRGSRDFDVITDNFKRYYHLKDRTRFKFTDPEEIARKKADRSM